MSSTQASLFLTGTDTNVGKTFVASLLLRALRKAGVNGVGMKPICCGDRGDAEELYAASDGVVSINDLNPVWLQTPAAPYTAAMIENRVVDIALIREAFARLHSKHAAVIVEGAGGWRVPVARDFFVSDLAREFALPVAVVVANKLGALNHALLTIESIRASGCECAGIILNHIRPAGDDIATITNRGVLEDLLRLPLLYEISWEQKDFQFPCGALAPRP